MLGSFSAAEKKLWLLWIVAVTGGTGFSVILIELVTNQLAFIIENQLIFTLFLVVLPLPGILIQWWALRPQLDQAWWWIPASLGSALSPLISIVAQWALLQRHIERAYWWPLLAFLLRYASQFYLNVVGAQFVTLIPLWLLSGAISGWLLVILLRQPLRPADGTEIDQKIKALEKQPKSRGDG